MEKLKRNEGITLVALVVTIIVLLILAAVSLGAVFSDKGIFSRAETSALEHRAGTVEDEVTVWKNEKQIAKYEQSTAASRDELIESQKLRGLLTDEEAETAKSTGKVKIGTKTIDYGVDDEQGTEKIVDVLADGVGLTASGKTVRLVAKSTEVETNTGKWYEYVAGEEIEYKTEDSEFRYNINEISGLPDNAVVKKDDAGYIILETGEAYKVDGLTATKLDGLSGKVSDVIYISSAYNESYWVFTEDYEVYEFFSSDYPTVDWTGPIRRTNIGGPLTKVWNFSNYEGYGLIEVNGSKYFELEYNSITERSELASVGEVWHSDGYYCLGATFALTRDGSLYAWGRNYDGQLGIGEQNALVEKPTKIEGIGSVVTFFYGMGGIYGEGGSVALNTKGEVYYWGVHCYGAENDAINYTVLPKKVEKLGHVVNIIESASYSWGDLEDKMHDLTCFAVDNEGKLYSWGSNSCGALGLGYGVEDNSRVDWSLEPICITDIESVEIFSKPIDKIKEFNNDIYVVGKDGTCFIRRES